MPLIKVALIAACAGSQPQYNSACNATTEAFTKQIGVYDGLVNAEKEFNRIVVRTTRNELGDDPLYVAGGGYYIYKTIHEKSLAFNLPTLGIADSIFNRIGINSYGISMSWKWP